MDAMAFYRSYFEDAGIGNEERILEELGSPENVAETIKRDLGMLEISAGEQANTKQEQAETADSRSGQQGYGSYDEANHTYTYRSGQSQYQQSKYDQSTYQRNQSQSSYTMYNDSTVAEEKKKKSNMLILLIIIAVLTFPIWIGIVGGLFGAIFGVSVTVIAFTFAMFAVGIAFVGVGIPMIMGISSAAGITFIGAGLLTLAIAIFMLNACIWIFGKLFPWVVTSIVALFKKTFGKNKEAQTA